MGPTRMSMNTSPVINDKDIIESSEIDKSFENADVTSSVFIGTKPALKNWKMFNKEATQDFSLAPDKEESLSTTAQRNVTERSISISRSAPVWLQIGQALAVFITVAWLSYAAIYILALPNAIKTITSSPLTLGGILASVLAPIAMMWLCIATWQRRSDAHIYAEALRDELRGLFYPNADQSNLISDDIRQLMKQATEMSASSRGAIKAIQRARTGLRAEIRDFAGVSQKAEFHIDRLADALSKRSEELLSLTETIEAQSEVISAKSMRGVAAWENVSSEITELGDEIDQIFDKGAEKLQNASDAATQKIQSLEITLANAVDNLSSRIESVSSQMDIKKIGFDEQVDNLNKISHSIEMGSEKLQTCLADAQTIYSTVESAMDTISTNLGRADEKSELFITKSELIEQKLQNRAQSIDTSTTKLLTITEELDKVGELATHKLAEALSMAISGADTIANTVRRSKDMIDTAVLDASNQIISTSKIADEKLENLVSEVRVNQEYLSNLISEMDKKSEDIKQTTQEIDNSSDRISKAVDRAVVQLSVVTSEMVDKTEEPLNIILSSINMLDSHAKEMDDKLSIRIVEVQQETTKIKSLIDGIDTSMKESLEHLTEASGQIANRANEVSEQIYNQKDLLSGFVSDVEEKTNIISGHFDEKLGAMQSSILSTQEMISNLGLDFINNGDAFTEKAANVSNKLSDYESLLNETIISINNQYSFVEDKVSGQIQFISQLSNYISPEADKILSKVESINSRYDDLKNKCFAITNEAINRFENLEEKIQVGIATISEESLKSSQNILAASNEMSTNLINIRTVSEEAQDRISQVQSGLKGHVDDLHLVSDRVQMKVEAMQDNLSLYAKDLSDVLQITISDLEVATDKFGQTTHILEEKSKDVASKIIDATEKYIEEGHRMSMVGEQAAHKSARILTVLTEETQKLVDTSNASILDLQKSGETLSIRTKEIEEYLKASATHTRNYGNELRDQASLIANHSSEVVDKISAATSSLSNRAKAVQEMGQIIFSQIEGAGAKLEEETDILGRVAKITIQAVDEAVVGFNQHGDTLKRTVDDLTTHINSVKEIKANTEKESFLNASKFVIESLYSLAVDVSRHLEGVLDVRVLRTYQKGDISAYIRHLVEVAPKIPVDKSQRKFIEDGEFRTYVLRFIRQYEELLIQAQANDYGDLLSSVFSTSDMGKLYKILCEIAGRSSKSH